MSYSTNKKLFIMEVRSGTYGGASFSGFDDMYLLTEQAVRNTRLLALNPEGVKERVLKLEALKQIIDAEIDEELHPEKYERQQEREED